MRLFKYMYNSNKIALGSAQWGFEYGVTNKNGQTCIEEVSRILDYAYRQGIELIDTANLYGKAEKTLGKLDNNRFKLVTKTPKFDAMTIKRNEIDKLQKSLNLSLEHLKSKGIYALIVHRSEDLLKEGGILLVNKMKELKEAGLVQKIGISIYDPSILDSIYKVFIPDIVQIPINIFDQRALKNNILLTLKEKNIEIHARSIFMQGILLAKLHDLPCYFHRWENHFRDWIDLCKNNTTTQLEAALLYVLNIQSVDKCIIGVESKEQLEQCLSTNKKEFSLDLSYLSNGDPNLIDPRKWKL